MQAVIELLKGNFVLVDLGSADASDLATLRTLQPAITLVELDAVGSSQTGSANYYRKVGLRGVIGGKKEKRIFHERSFSQSSSFLETNTEVVSDYGLERFVKPVQDHELECQTLESLLTEHNIGQVDWLKSDLEGIDYEVLASAPELISRTLVVQSELRFQPYYIGEPHFHTVVKYLSELGLELITLRPEIWKYNTPNRNNQRDGRLVWADALFFLSPEVIQTRFDKHLQPAAFLKQVILAKANGLNNYAEYLFERYQSLWSPEIVKEIRADLQPTGLQSALNRVMSIVAHSGGGRVQMLLLGTCRSIARSCFIHRSLPHIAPPF